MNLPQWWLDLSEKEQAEYLEQHPASKLRDSPPAAEPEQGGGAEESSLGPAGPAESTLPKGGEKFRRVVPKAFANRNFHKVMGTEAGRAAASVLAEDEKTSEVVARAAAGVKGGGVAEEDKKAVHSTLHTAMLGLALGMVVLGALIKEQVEPLSDFCDDAAGWLVDRAGKGPVLDADGNLVMDAEDTGEEDEANKRFSDEELDAARDHAERLRGTTVTATPQHDVTVREDAAPDSEDWHEEDVSDDPTQGNIEDGSVREAHLARSRQRAMSALAGLDPDDTEGLANAKWLMTYTVAWMKATATAATTGSVN